MLDAARELGVRAMDRNGDLLWKINGHDILADFCMEKKQIVRRLEDGKVLSHEPAQQ
jgi:hypothetical protein